MVSAAVSSARPIVRNRFAGDFYEQSLRGQGVILGLLWQQVVHRHLDMPEGGARWIVAGMLAFGSVWGGSMFSRGFLVPEKRTGQ